MMLNKVDLPQPDGPITPTNSPGATDSDTLSSAMTTPSGVSKRLTMSSTARIAEPAAGATARADDDVTAAMAALASPDQSCPGRARPYSTFEPRKPTTTQLRCAPAAAGRHSRLTHP